MKNCLAASARSGFTLAELLVSLVILVAMMTMVAMIFSTAGKSSGVAQAQTRLHRQLQQVMDTIKRDLENSGPDGSTPLLAIANVQINAKDLPQSKDPRQSRLVPHRADLLMVITAQPFEPFIYQSRPGGIDNTTFAAARQVVYSHANVGKLDINGNWLPASIRYVETHGATDAFSASQWHLTRRVLGFAQPGSNLQGAGWAAPATMVDPTFTGAASGTNVLLPAPVTKIADVAAYPTGLTGLLPSAPTEPNGPFHGVYKYTWDSGAGTYQLYDCYADRPFGWFRYLGLAGLPVFKLDGLAPDLFWWEWKNSPNRWELVFPSGPASPQPSPNVPPVRPTTPWPDYWYNGSATRTQIDPMPPAGMSSRMASYFLPSCAEFKVEFTYDDPNELAVHQDVRVAALNYQPLLLDNVSNPNNPANTPAPTPIRWQSVPPGEQWVWYGVPVEGSLYSAPPGDLRDKTFPFRWPKALRITIRAYAPGGALDYPVEQTLVHVWK